MKDKNLEENLKKDLNTSTSKQTDNQINSNKKSIKENETTIDNKEKEIKIGNYLIKKTLGKGTFGKLN